MSWQTTAVVAWEVARIAVAVLDAMPRRRRRKGCGEGCIFSAVNTANRLEWGNHHQSRRAPRRPRGRQW